MSSGGWCTIESDPAVFTEMLEKLGVEGLSVEELIALEPSFLDQLGTVHGLILLFKWKPQHRQVNFQKDSALWFAQQVVQDACATQAILNILMNRTEVVGLGQTLTAFHEFTQPMDPKTRGELVGQSDAIREAHNSFARSTVFSFEEKVSKTEDDDVYHFVSYLYKHGAIWELDGLQPSPVLCCDTDEHLWKEKIIETIQARIAELSALDTTGQGQGISFTLLAVVNDRIVEKELELAILQSGEQPTALVEAELQELREIRERGRLENARRRHNYVPALVALLRALAEQGKLEGIMKQAKERAAAAKEAKKPS